MNWYKANKLVLTACFLISSGMSTLVYSDLDLSGFISVGGGSLIDDDEINSYTGFDGAWNTDPDTTLALQATASVSDKVTVTGQLIAHGAGAYEVEAEWAYVTYAATDDWRIRVGRLRSPFFTYSDFLDVGYAYPWIRPPEQVYRFLFTTVEGFDTIYTSTVGDWYSTLQAYFGRLTDETSVLGELVPIDLQTFTGINWSLSNDWLTVRTTWNQADFSIGAPSALTPLLDALNSLGFSSVADALEIKDEAAAFWGIGANIDYKNWLLITEYTELLVDNQSLVGDDEAWYLMLGRRFGDFTFHVTYQSRESNNDLDFIDAIPAGVAPALDGLRDIVAGTITDTKNEVFTVGMRYDFAPSTAFKIELSDIDFNGRDGTLLSFSIDAVF